MLQPIEESLFKAIKNDDIKAFNALNEKVQCGEYRLGRFPVLSLLYLYSSRRLISVYEETFLKIADYKVLNEPVEVSRKFSAKAGKCLRLYLNEAVSPIEMLLIMDRTKHLKRVYPKTKASMAVKERLKSIYFIKYSLEVKFNGDEIIIDRRPLSYREKKSIAIICLCSVLSVTVAVGVPVTTVALIPKPVEGEVTKLSHIDFSSSKEYTLKRDISLPENFSVNKVNCKIIGEGNKLILGKGATLGDFNGKISDLTIETFGSPIFNYVSEKAIVENITVNVSADIAVAEATALVALTNYGTIDGITVNVSGKINALAASTEVIDEPAFGGIVQNNNYKYNSVTNTVYRGVIKNCNLNYTNFNLIGETGANASFGGIAGINNGYLQDCMVEGAIFADTFDVAGVCSVNNGLLSGNINETSISQTSDDAHWNPIACGIVLNNSYAVENCENRGKISAISTCGAYETNEEYESMATAAGIAYLSRGSSTTPYIKKCINSGEVECSAEYRNTYAAGICISSNGGIEGCKNGGTVSLKSGNNCEMHVGGITAISYGNIYNSVNEGTVSASEADVAYAGGITAHCYSQVSNCLSSGEITVSAQKVCVGGISGVNEITSYSVYVYFGTVNYCISDCRLNITVIDSAPARVGGIVGDVCEEGYDTGNSIQYWGGAVTNSYFTGECTSKVSYFGNIVGVCGENIYKNNSYSSGFNVYHNFDGNYILSSTQNAFGAVIAEDGSYSSAEDKGVTTASIEEIRNSEAYKSILDNLAK